MGFIAFAWRHFLWRTARKSSQQHWAKHSSSSRCFKWEISPLFRQNTPLDAITYAAEWPVQSSCGARAEAVNWYFSLISWLIRDGFYQVRGISIFCPHFLFALRLILLYFFLMTRGKLQLHWRGQKLTHLFIVWQILNVVSYLFVFNFFPCRWK